MKAYKVFDSNWSNFDYSFKKGKRVIGTTHKFKGRLNLCSSGFHFSRELVNCFSYKSFNPENKVAEIEILGDVIGDKEDKECTNHFKIIRELTWEEVLRKCNIGKNNSGYRNSGNWNSGYRNSGNWNSGDWNSGDRNSGYWNSGDWNSCNNETGYFNSEAPTKIRIFNKYCSKDKWDNIEKPQFIYNINLNIWISWDDMTDKEKETDKNAHIRGGYLKTYTYKEAWKNAYKKATEKDIKLLKALPNFNKKVFKEIAGIDINKKP